MQRTFARKVMKMSEENDVKDASTEGEYDAYEPEDEEATPAEGLPYDEKRKNGSREAPLQACQVEKCSADLSDAKRYHRHHKVCEVHAKAHTVIVAGLRQRFCQQCSRFHEVGEFDESRRSCRRRLAGHNERRRKSGTRDYHGGNSSRSWRGVLRRRKVTAGNRMKGAESGL